MKTLLAITFATLMGTTALSPTLADPPAQPPVEDGPVLAETQFMAVDIVIDPQGNSLGAYQFEMTSPDASFTVVGVEAGNHEAFDHGRPPYFDPVATQNNTVRLVVAEYAVPKLDDQQLPTQPVLVATVHVMFTGPLQEQPDLKLTLITAGNADGEPIDAKTSHTFRNHERPLR